MKSHYRVVVIGGGIVGVSVLYHLTRAGWPDVALIERSELTAGSTWHAAAGFHAVNADPTIAALQRYTIGLYRELQAAGHGNLGLKFTGAVTFAGTDERWEWLHAALASFRTLGLDKARLVSADEIAEMCPIIDADGIRGGLFDPDDGYLDPYGTTHAFASAARAGGADVILRNRVLSLHPEAGGWRVETEQGTIHAEHVVNAAGLWARPVGRMAGVDLPVTPMEHHYLVTEPVPGLQGLSHEIPTLVDLEGFTYARQEGMGMLLGVYERNPKAWKPEGAPWDYGIELLPPDIDRISDELQLGFARYPALQTVGIKRWVNGAFTFTPDGNPLIGPVPGLRNYWAACGVMAGFSQGGGVGLAVARWIVDGDPGADVFGMDVARYGPHASTAGWLAATTRQFYARRFLIAYPNEQLPAGRPLRTPPSYDQQTAAGAVWGQSWGMEVPLYFADQPGFVERPTLQRSEAFGIVAREVHAVREGLTLLDTQAFSRFEVSGQGAEGYLDRLLACRLPGPGRIRLAPMLSPSGRLMGDLTVFNWGDGRYWLMGSYYLRAWHLRWFEAQNPGADVMLRDISDQVAGVALTGAAARTLIGELAGGALDPKTLPFMGCTALDLGVGRVHVGRISVMGEHGYELNAPAAEMRSLYAALHAAGQAHGVVPVGFHALGALRLEKSYGIWSREFTSGYTPRMSGLDRFVAFDKPDFIGRDAVLADRDGPAPARRLVTLAIDAETADASGFEPVWAGDHLVGQTTSGGYGHWVGQSLAMAYVDAAVVEGDALAVDVLGRSRAARIIPPSPYDPGGARLRGQA